MSAKLYQVEPKKLEPAEGLVKLLERLLERARAGQLISMAFAAEYKQEAHNGGRYPRGVEWGISGYRWNSALLGGLEVLKGEMVREALESKEDLE